jgi:hypothetical protein
MVVLQVIEPLNPGQVSEHRIGGARYDADNSDLVTQNASVFLRPFLSFALSR